MQTRRFLELMVMAIAGGMLAMPTATSAAGQNPFLAEVMGRAQLILGEEYVVSGQKLDGACLIWVNARVDVERDHWKLDVSTRPRVKMVPAEGGVVIEFSEPFVLLERPHDRHETRNVPEKGTFEVFITVSEKLAMVVKGEYGKQFPQRHVDALMKLATTFVPD